MFKRISNEKFKQIGEKVWKHVDRTSQLHAYQRKTIELRHNHALSPHSIIKYKGRTSIVALRYRCCRFAPDGGREHIFKIFVLADGGDAWNRKRNGEWRYRFYDYLYICGHCLTVHGPYFC